MCQSSIKIIIQHAFKTATIELGWLLIMDELDMKRASYYLHLNQMDDGRPTKVFFNQLKQLYVESLNYFQNIQILHLERDMDHMFYDSDNYSISAFKDSVQTNYRDSF